MRQTPFPHILFLKDLDSIPLRRRRLQAEERSQADRAPFRPEKSFQERETF
jgi:hypothetical protein